MMQSGKWHVTIITAGEQALSEMHRNDLQQTQAQVATLALGKQLP